MRSIIRISLILVVIACLLSFSFPVLARDPIIIGSEAINRATSDGPEETLISKANPANDNGVITSVEIWAATNIGGCKIGIFYEITVGTYHCRSATSIGNVTAGSKQVFSDL